jgi:hypothetical protein
LLAWGSAGILGVAAIGLGLFSYRHMTEAPSQVLRFAVTPPEKAILTGFNPAPALSPDGRHLVIRAEVAGIGSLWIRDLDSLRFRSIPGTEDAQYPFWSPDSQSVAFFVQNAVKRVDLSGGSAVTVCKDCRAGGGTWNRDGVILVGGARSDSSPIARSILRVSAGEGLRLPCS